MFPLVDGQSTTKPRIVFPSYSTRLTTDSQSSPVLSKSSASLQTLGVIYEFRIAFHGHKFFLLCWENINIPIVHSKCEIHLRSEIYKICP